MAKEAFYFSHDYGARNDPKLQKVLMKLGQEGKGVFWDLIEMSFEEGGKLLLSECESYAFALRTKVDTILSLINDFGLFEKDTVYFWSHSVLNRLNLRNEKSEKARISAKKRWDNANALPVQSECNAIKEMKGNKRKGKEIKQEDKNISKLIFDFEQFYNSLNDKKIRMTAQIQEKVKNALIDEDFELWKEVIEKSANKGHFINNRFIPLSAENMIDNYTKILEKTYGLLNREETKITNGDNYYANYNRV